VYVTYRESICSIGMFRENLEEQRKDNGTKVKSWISFSRRRLLTYGADTSMDHKANNGRQMAIKDDEEMKEKKEVWREGEEEEKHTIM